MLPRTARLVLGIDDDERGAVGGRGFVAPTAQMMGGGEPGLTGADHNDIDEGGVHAGKNIAAGGVLPDEVVDRPGAMSVARRSLLG